ncbi:MAG: PTS lactose/cellobiose transporter subunit IIA [Propionicimonas sp.]
MPDPADYEAAFQIISSAGNAKSEAMLAIRAAREGDFAEAAACLKRADEQLHDAHVQQTDLITAEARGEAVPLNVILVHAQDHLTGALLTRDLAEEFLQLYQRVTEAGR